MKFGLPGALLHLDEPPVVLRAQQVLETGDWNPHWFHYPTLYLYLQVLLQGLAGFAGGVHPFLLARVSTVVAGILTLWATYVLGRETNSRTVGLLAALFLSTSFLHARESHFATVDGLATLWVTLCLFFTVRVFRAKARAKVALVLAAVLAGLAAGTKYNAALVGVAPLAAVLTGSVIRPRWIWVGVIVAVGVATFLAVTPYAISDWGTFVEDVRFESRHYRDGHFGFEGDSNALYFARYLFSPGLGEGIFIFVILGLVAWFVRRDRILVPVLVFLAIYCSSISAVRVNFVRNLLPVLPVLGLLAAGGVDLVLRRLPGSAAYRRLVTLGLVAALIALPVSRGVVYDRAIADSTRPAAGGWIGRHLPSGSTLVTELYGPEPIPPGYRVIRVLHLTNHPVEWYREQGVDYVVASSGAYEMAYSNRTRYPLIVKRYDDIFRQFPLVMEFQGERVDPVYSSICPTLRILAVPHETTGQGDCATRRQDRKAIAESREPKGKD